MTAPMPRAGAVYDRGYRPYDGELGGRRAARLALVRTSIRRALGIRRSWRQKFFPWLLLGVVSVPAVINVGIAYLTRDRPTGEVIELISYREYVGFSTALLLFITLTAPDAVCPDRRNRTLPLLFARPLTGSDYVVAKVGAIAAIVFAFGMIPQILLFVGQMLVADSSLDYLGDNAAVIVQVPVAVSLLAVYYSSLSVAVSALATRRMAAAASLTVLLLTSSIVSGVLSGPDEMIDRDGSRWAAINILATPLQLRDLVFEGEIVSGDLAGAPGGAALAAVVFVVVVASSLGSLLWRYRWIER